MGFFLIIHERDYYPILTIPIRLNAKAKNLLLVIVEEKLFLEILFSFLLRLRNFGIIHVHREDSAKGGEDRKKNCNNINQYS
jgi:hypothetical protein